MTLEPRVIILPYVLVTFVTILLPGLWLAGRYRRRRRERSGHCAVCGYDLRATPERCPECGAVPSAQQARPGEAGG